MSAMDEIASISYLLPLPILKDISQRCGDWLATGGNHDDPYIHQQLRFANNYLKAQGVK